jgi:hypothetical protein
MFVMYVCFFSSLFFYECLDASYQSSRTATVVLHLQDFQVVDLEGQSYLGAFLVYKNPDSIKASSNLQKLGEQSPLVVVTDKPVVSNTTLDYIKSMCPCLCGGSFK